MTRTRVLIVLWEWPAPSSLGEIIMSEETGAQGSGESKMNAVLIGATGAIGRCLLGSLLQAKVNL